MWARYEKRQSTTEGTEGTEEVLEASTPSVCSVPSVVTLSRAESVPMTTPLLSVRNVIKSYHLGGLFGRSANAVDDVSFEMSTERAEILAIIGESGSGKTTLARMILGTVRPSAGSILFNGAPLAAAGGRRERLGFMQQGQPT